MVDTITAARCIRPRKEIDVTVRYPAAAKPFRDNNAALDETVGALKVRVLQAFGLDAGGDAVSYQLFHGRAALDEARTLGAIEASEDDRDRELQLKLAQQVTQG